MPCPAASATPADHGRDLGGARKASAPPTRLLVQAGEEFGISLFGSRALDAREARRTQLMGSASTGRVTDRSKARLDRFVAYGKDADFIGKQA
ncbi:hypothetical protein ACVOMV_21135 [Mesorhizobium atlanticum]